MFATEHENVDKRRWLEDILKGTDLAAAEQILVPVLHELRKLGQENNAAGVEAAVREAIFLKKLHDKDPPVLFQQV